MRTLPAISLGFSLFGSLLPAEDLGAQAISSPYRFVERKTDLGPYAAWLLSDRASSDLGPKSGRVYGLQFARRISDPIQISLFGGYFDSERDVIDPSPDSPAEVIGTVDQNIVLLALRLQFNLTGARTWHNLIPYLLGGIGLAIDASSQPSCLVVSTNLECQLDTDAVFDFGTHFMGQFGLGSIWLLSERLGFRGTIHNNLWRLTTPPAFLDPERNQDPAPREQEWTNNIQISLGVSYWF